MSSGTFKAKIKPMNGGIQIRPTPTVKAVSDPITYICCYKIVLMFYNTKIDETIQRTKP